ncbi:acyl-CoA dehydrogenase family protein [Rhodovulum sp. DZ06]|uniref:acyl-CoA dehydrogenase family protein n=1 Tax=Rhodovulum sp. DZ06 TaxID=3425126 RepID=UPI003D344456
MYDATRPDHDFSEAHQAFRASLRAFVEAEIIPNLPAWEAAGRLPRDLYRKAAAVGVQGAVFPEALGGSGGDLFMQMVLTEELSRAGAGGVVASLCSHSIAIPPIVRHGSDDLKARVAVPVIAGEAIAALAITEPGGGSDVAALRTTARRDGDDFVVDGEKIFITSGMQADFITAAVRTDPCSQGMYGISLLVIPGDAKGLERSPLDKMGWHASDTAHLRFDGVRVPAANLVGEEGAGFRAVMMNFNDERLFMAAQAAAMAQVCFDEALSWARERRAFGKPLIEQQVIRHKLADMAGRIDAARTLAYDVTRRRMAGLDPLNIHVARTSMAKVMATDAMKFCADEAVQILGGMGFMRGTASERIYREVKVMTIGGGTDETMRNLAAAQLGF